MEYHKLLAVVHKMNYGSERQEVDKPLPVAGSYPRSRKMPNQSQDLAMQKGGEGTDHTGQINKQVWAACCGKQERAK